MKQMKGILSFALALMMAFALLSAAAFAADASATPTVSDAAATKLHLIQTDLVYTLTNSPAYGSDTDFKVYADAAGTVYATGVTATLSGSALTLHHDSNLPVGKLYVTATESGKAESDALELTVKVNTGKVVFFSKSQGGYASKLITYYTGKLGSGSVTTVDSFAGTALDGASMAVVCLPKEDLSAGDLKALQALLDSGGRVFLVGEFSAFSPAANARVSAIAQTLGGTFSVLNGTGNPKDIENSQYYCAGDNIGDSELAAGITKFYTAASAPISTGGSVVPVFYAYFDQNVETPHTGPFCVDQAVGNGRITAVTDVNIFDSYVNEEGNQKFFDNLLSCAVAAQNKVMNDENPNAGFGGSPTYAVNASMVSKADAGKSSYSFGITYTSQNASAFDEATVGTDDVTVENAGGTALSVTDASVTSGTGTDAITVTYTVTPPGGAWDAADNGPYTIAIANAAITTADGKQNGGSNNAGGFTVDLNAGPLQVNRTVTLTDSDTGITGFQYKINDAASYTAYSGAFTVAEGDKLELMATLANGYAFTRWADGVTANPLTVASVSGDIAYTPVSAENAPAPSPSANPGATSPAITAPTQDQQVAAAPGSTATLSVTAPRATGYQWYVDRNDGKGFVALPGATEASYTTATLTAADDGYRYRCTVSNAAGELSAQSPVFTLSVTANVKNPQTGDPSSAGILGGTVLLLAAGLLGSVVIFRRKRRES